MSEVIRRLESVHVVRTPYVEFEFRSPADDPLPGVGDRRLHLHGGRRRGLDRGAVGRQLRAGPRHGAGVHPLVPRELGLLPVLEYRYAGQTWASASSACAPSRRTACGSASTRRPCATWCARWTTSPPVPGRRRAGADLAEGAAAGDLAGGTVVVRDRRRAIPASIARPASSCPRCRSARWRTASQGDRRGAGGAPLGRTAPRGAVDGGAADALQGAGRVLADRFSWTSRCTCPTRSSWSPSPRRWCRSGPR
jgi:hypothetical protein